MLCNTQKHSIAKVQKHAGRPAKSRIVRVPIQDGSVQTFDNGVVARLTWPARFLGNAKGRASLQYLPGPINIHLAHLSFPPEVAKTLGHVLGALGGNRIAMNKTRVELLDGESLLFAKHASVFLALGVDVVSSDQLTPIFGFTLEGTMLGPFLAHFSGNAALTIWIERLMQPEMCRGARF